MMTFVTPFPTLHLAGQPDADELLATDAFALLVGMVLDQQIPLERAFAAPLELRKRLGGELSVSATLDADPDEFIAAFCAKPAVHRFPAANAKRVIQLAEIIHEQYADDAASIWTTASSGSELLNRIEALPGFGKQKAKIFQALLGKQFGIRPDGWQAACAPFGEEGTTMSVADITDAESLAAVRAWKAAKKAAENS
jgi:uncharacterized HhH-GPD family protein